MKKTMITIVVIAALGGAAAAWLLLSPRPTRRLVYDVGAPREQVEQRGPELARAAAAVVRRRLDAMEIFGLEVKVEGGQIHVDLPEVAPEKLAAVKRVLARDARLGLRMVDDASDLPARIGRALAGDSSVAVGHDRYHARAREVRYTTITGSSPEALERALAALPARLRPPGDREFLAGPVAAREPGGEPRFQLYYVASRSEVLGTHVEDARVEWDANTARPHVFVVFTADGRERFARLTRANTGRRLAMVINDRVTSAPVIMEAITGGRAQITMGHGVGQDPLELELEAREIAGQLRSGRLPAPLTLLRTEPI